MRGYSIPDLLIGHYYRSVSNPAREGIIQAAERREDVLDADYVYSVRVRPTNGFPVEPDFWATVFVDTESR